MSDLASKFSVLIILSILIISGCRDRHSDSIPVSYSFPVLDSCKNEPDHHYFVSQPEFVSENQKIPLIIVIDPHGDGKFALEKFTRAMGNIPAIIAGSEKLKNNYAGFELSLSHLHNDLLGRYPVDPLKVIIAGFSGGARMAYAYGMRHKVLGIIMYGAGPGQAGGKMANQPIYAVSGTRDFNFMEQYLPPFSGINDNLDYTSDFFRGKHEWPPAKNIYESVAYMLKNLPGQAIIIPDEISDKLMLEYDSLLGSNDLFFAAKALEKAWKFSPDEAGRTRITRQINEFKNLPAWIDYNYKFESYLEKELKLKQAYASHLTEPDTIWWKKEINSLNQNLLSCSDPVQEDFLYRIQGFIGIILYSQINAHLQNDLLSQELTNLLLIYEYAEPESADLLIFKSKVLQLTRK